MEQHNLVGSEAQKEEKKMTQIMAERIADWNHIAYGPVTFYRHGRGWNIRGYNCYDRVCEIYVQ